MKSFIFVSLFAFTAVAAPITPNLYECQGKGVKVGYTTSSIDGKPTFQIDGRNFRDKQIGVQGSLMGKQVSVVLEAIADLHTRLATLIVPSINLKEAHNSVTFKTQLVRTLSRTSFGGPALVDGVLQENQFTEVECEAKSVAF